MLRIPPKMGCKELEDLSPTALKELQLAFKAVRCLVVDEKGRYIYLSRKGSNNIPTRREQ
jgi:hypothetical protein